MTSDDHARQANSGRVFGGLVIILAGLALLLDRSAIWEVRLSSHYWPLLPIALGALKLLDPPAWTAGRDPAAAAPGSSTSAAGASSTSFTSSGSGTRRRGRC